MKAKDLLAALQQLSASELELEVYGFADHGQTPEQTSPPQIIWISKKDPYQIYDYKWATDEEEAKENGYKHKAILL